MSELIGRTLGQYQIIEQIGEGGMATVYKAYQPGLNRYVAIKVLPPIHAKQPGFTERFQREAEAIANLYHPNILPVHDFGQEEGYSYIAMRHVEGARTLKEVMADHLKLAQVADLIGQIAAALDHAHQRGIIHRDVKPSNVMMDGNWALLTDFGLAKMTEASIKLTGSGVGVGTPAYMSPEQAQGLEVDCRTDVYSLGIILFEMVTGEIPHHAETPLAIVLKRITEPLPIPHTINPDIPEPVEQVVLKALARDPDDRFASAGEMAEALKQAVSVAAVPGAADETLRPAVQKPPTVQPVETLPPLQAEEALALPVEEPSVPTQVPVRPTFPWTPASRWVAGIGAGVVVVVLLVWGLSGGFRGKGQPTATPTAPTVAALAPTSTPTVPASTSTPVPTASTTPTPTAGTTPTPTSASSIAELIVVPANTRWEDTGIAVQKGDEIQITHVSGEWRTEPGVSWTNGFECTGNPCGDCLLPTAPEGSLIAKVDSGIALCVGRSSFVSTSSGVLHLSFNDNSGGFRDNEGSLTVQVKIIRPTPSSAPVLGKLSDTWTRPTDGAVMVYVPAGEFWMGSDDDDPDAGDNEKPKHQVYVDAFWIDQTEVTNAQYKRCVDAGACSPPSPSSSNTRASYYGNPEFDDYPVIYVTWRQAQQYTAWVGGRLPTEAEWEYAARGPDARTYPWGNSKPNDSLLNYNLGGDTTAVGSYPDGVSWCGALDMAGNVVEWTQSIYKDYPYDAADGREDLDAKGDRVSRGGAFNYASTDVRCPGGRGSINPNNRHDNFGFRVVFPADTVTPIPAPEAGATQVREKDGAVMAYVPAGEFWMGSDDSDPDAGGDEKPKHKVYVDAFWIDQTEVTNAQYKRCVDAGACSPPSQSSSDTRDSYYGNPEFDDYPVIYVTWHQAFEYAAWVGGRLPTEAEWEYAARGPDARTYPWGNDPPNDSLLNYDGNVGHTSAVGSYPDGASWCGALDMGGNVLEWTSSAHREYPYNPGDGRESLDAEEGRVMRGGSLGRGSTDVRCGYRYGGALSDLELGSFDVGFRVVFPADTTAPIPAPEAGATQVREKDGAVMAYVPAGEFWMGSSDDNIDAVVAGCGDCDRGWFTDEQPQHKVYVDAFWIDQTEVTNAQYKRCVDAGACSPPSGSESNTPDSYYDNPEYDNHPVIFVSWYQAREYAKWVGGRLPSEAEWEYAARGPDARTYPWGNDPPNDSLLNYDGNVGHTSAVGSYPDGASWCRALDMAGNVLEWTRSVYREYPYDPDDGRENLDASGIRVMRGGSLGRASTDVRCAYRYGEASPDLRSYDVGFRVVLSPD